MDKKQVLKLLYFCVVLSVNLAVREVLAGRKTIILDADPQASSYQWCAIREASNISCHKITDYLQLHSLQTYNEYDTVIIDVGGMDSELFRAAIVASAGNGIVVIPLLASLPDIWGVENTFKVIVQARKLNVPIKAVGVFNAIKPSSKLPIQARQAVEFLCKQSNINLLACTIGDREIFRQSFQSGLGVVEYDAKSKASAEIIELHKQILGGMQK